MDLRNDPRTLSMMEVVPPPKPRELSESEQWYYAGMANAHPVNYGAGAQACTDEELARLSMKMYGQHLQGESQLGADFWSNLLGGAF